MLEGLEEMPKLLGSLHAAEHALIALLPLWAMCDRWDIGGLSTNVHFQTGRPTIFVYDGHSGGVGITERGFERFEGWVADTAQLLDGLPLRARLPVVRAEPEVRQPQRAARQGRRAAAPPAPPRRQVTRLSLGPVCGKCHPRQAVFVASARDEIAQNVGGEKGPVAAANPRLDYYA